MKTHIPTKMFQISKKTVHKLEQEDRMNVSKIHLALGQVRKLMRMKYNI